TRARARGIQTPLWCLSLSSRSIEVASRRIVVDLKLTIHIGQSTHLPHAPAYRKASTNRQPQPKSRCTDIPLAGRFDSYLCHFDRFDGAISLRLSPPPKSAIL